MTLINILPFQIQSVFKAMAMDEILLYHTNITNQGFLRVYSFDKPSITLGYFQKSSGYTENDVPWTRRLTGGGIVEHGKDWIITFTGKIDGTNIRPSHLYKNIHSAIKKALSPFIKGLKLNETTPPVKPGENSFCFKAPVMHDICFNDKKIAGGAISVKKDCFLYQGALNVFHFLDNDKTRLEICKNLKKEIMDLNPGSELNSKFNFNTILSQAEMLSVQKYEQEEWKRKF